MCTSEVDAPDRFAVHPRIESKPMPYETDPTKWTVSRDPLPKEQDMNRDDALDAFVIAANLTRPDHPYKRQSVAYPLVRSEVEYASTRSYHARCGPRKGYNTAYYATRMTYINDISTARHLALLAHEVTHIETCDGGRHESGHPPRFWRLMALYGSRLADALRDGRLDCLEKRPSAKALERGLVDDPNPATVDERFWTVDEARSEVARLIGRPDLAPNAEDPIEPAISTRTPTAGDR